MRVKELRDWLDKQEAKHTKDDEEYLGKFEDINILTTAWEWDNSTQQSHFKGWSYNNHIYYDVTGLGFFIDTKEEN